MGDAYYSGYQSSTTTFSGFMGGEDGDNFNKTLGRVSEGISQMAANYGTITRMTKDVGGPKDTPKLREALSQHIKQTVAVVRDIQNAFIELEKLSANSRERRERIAQIHQKFDSFNQKFSDICSIAKEKISDQPVIIDFNIPTSQLYVDSQSGYLPQQQQQQLQRQIPADFNRLEAQRLESEREMEMREREIRKLQGQMIDVNGIFKELSELVALQAPLVSNIEDNIDTAADHVSVANVELKKGEELQKANRKWLCWIAVGIAVAVFFILLVVVLSANGQV